MADNTDDTIVEFTDGFVSAHTENQEVAENLVEQIAEFTMDFEGVDLDFEFHDIGIEEEDDGTFHVEGFDGFASGKVPDKQTAQDIAEMGDYWTTEMEGVEVTVEFHDTSIIS